jgi:hypothetical protein
MRRFALLALLVAACGSSSKGSNASSAAERARLEHADSGEKDVDEPEGGSWGGWRYQGATDDCFFVVGRKCFAEEKAACKAAKCKKGKCKVEGGGPATISCSK